MKTELHPEYREVLFHDTSSDTYFLINSTVQTNETKEYEGETYPYMTVDISSASHPSTQVSKNLPLETAGWQDLTNAIIETPRVLLTTNRVSVLLKKLCWLI